MINDPHLAAPGRSANRLTTANKVAGVLLAAGISRRMGDANKLLLKLDGVPIIRLSALNMLAGGIRDLIIVTGHQQAAVMAALSDLPVKFVHNPAYRDGQSGSVASGISQLVDWGPDGALIALGDMPFLSPDLIAALVRDHAGLADGRDRITFPVHNGQRGNPVMWGAGFFAELVALSGDTGGRALLADHAGAVNSFSWGDDSIHRDIDTPAAFSKASPLA